MSVTIEDVAVRANLNKGSVSRILNGKGEGYSAATRKRVLETAAEMGYQPNALARALWTGQTQTIGLWQIQEEFYSPYFAYLQFCAQRLVDKANYKLITETLSMEIAQKSQILPGTHWPVDGIISYSLPPEADAYLHAVVKKDCPIVALQQGNFHRAVEYPNTDYINVDLYAGAKQAVRHLLESGCQRVGFIAPTYMLSGASISDGRTQAYLELMDKAGKAVELITVQDETRRCSRETLVEYIKRNGCPDGLFCSNDEFAIGSYLALQDQGIRVPDEALLVGCDGLENSREFPCPISSIAIPLEEMCALAWEMLSQRMMNPDLPLRREMLPCRLEVRASSKRAT